MEESPCQQFDTTSLILRLDEEIPCDVAAIEPLVARIMTIVGEVGCVPGSESEVELALREALSNAVVHGCGEKAGGTVQITVACDEARGMLIVVRDPGSGFDPDSIPSPILGQNIYSAHGRGIFLIRRLMDEVHFTEGGTRIYLCKSPGSEPSN